VDGRVERKGDVCGSGDRAFSGFAEMLDHAEWMFIRANDVLNHHADGEEARDSIYRRDQSINDLTKSIRRKVVRHLTINPGSDIAANLALMCVAKDAERIGGYCMNVFEVGRFYKEEFTIQKYEEPLEAIRGGVENLFRDVGIAGRGCWHLRFGQAFNSGRTLQTSSCFSSSIARRQMVPSS